jgi:hypothetical protein
LRDFEHRPRTAGTCSLGERFWSRLIASGPSAHTGTILTEPGRSGLDLVVVKPGTAWAEKPSNQERRSRRSEFEFERIDATGPLPRVDGRRNSVGCDLRVLEIVQNGPGVKANLPDPVALNSSAAPSMGATAIPEATPVPGPSQGEARGHMPDARLVITEM